MKKETGEKCARCGEVEEDRRTLWMSCFYQMDELNVPFDQISIYGENLKLKSFKLKPLFKDGPTVKDFKFEKPKGKQLDKRTFYTLRVCKDCRADWMDSIQKWFTSKPWAHDKLPVNSGIFIRRNGATVEISEEEWSRQNPGREPVRVIL